MSNVGCARYMNFNDESVLRPERGNIFDSIFGYVCRAFPFCCWIGLTERIFRLRENSISTCPGRMLDRRDRFSQAGKASCGVARQYTGSAGKITNCQIGVFASYVSRHGHAFIDRALYLPKEWTDDPDRLKAAYVPPDTGFATKPKLATGMIARAIAASVPFKWFAGDTVYGVGNIEQQLRQAGKGYVLGVSSAHVFNSWGKRRSVSGTAADIAATRRSSDWKRLSAGDGTDNIYAGWLVADQLQT